MAAFVMRETNEVDSLVDQLNGTMFSRYVDANNLSNFIGGGGMDNKEVIIMRSILLRRYLFTSLLYIGNACDESYKPIDSRPYQIMRSLAKALITSTKRETFALLLP